jgi:hypothetical protein
MEQTGKKKVDAILLLAKASFTGRRRPSLITLLVCLAVLVLLIGVLTWRLWPQPSLPQLILVAFDQLALPDEEVAVTAALEPTRSSESQRNLSGCPLYFQDLATGERLGKVKTDAFGAASVMKAFPRAPATTEIMVRYPGEPDRQKGDESKATVFVWPPDTSVLIVDVLKTVADADYAAFHSNQNLDIRPRAGAAAALRSVPTKYRVMYLGRGTLPSDYRKVKAWLEQSAGSREHFPAAPVLRVADDELVSDTHLRNVVSNLKSRFTVTATAITGSEATARVFQQLGLKTYVLEETRNAPEGVIQVKSWKEFAGQIAK